jgi:hypothetical protein
MEPLVITGNQGSRFKYWFDGDIQEGLLFRNELFRCLYRFDASRRMLVYELAYAFAQYNVQALILFDQPQYQVWVSLRTHQPPQAALETQTLSEQRQAISLSQAIAHYAL